MLSALCMHDPGYFSGLRRRESPCSHLSARPHLHQQTNPRATWSSCNACLALPEWHLRP